MNRKFISVLAMMVALVAFAACSSINQITPSEWDDAAIEADVRAKIASDVPDQTFSVGVKVEDRVVTLTGTAASSAQRTEIANAAARVDGVRRVINNIQVQ
ncbi:MAG: BON domain-containing protein [Thermoanaerobaculia bacterium]